MGTVWQDRVRIATGETVSVREILDNMAKKPAEKVIHKAMRSIDKIYRETPAFTDIFDEETWYQFCFVFVCSTIVCVFLLARYIDIRSIDPCDKEHKGVKARAGTLTPRPGKKTKDSMYKEE